MDLLLIVPFRSLLFRVKKPAVFSLSEGGRIHGYHRQKVTSSVAYVFQTHAQLHKAFKIPYILNYLRRALNTPDERFGTERSTREYRLYILYRGRWEEGCGAYKADCPSCIPSRLLGILSPHPLFFTRARDDSLFLSRRLLPLLSSVSLVVRAPFIAASNIHRI